MKVNQTYAKCTKFDNRELCPHRNDGIMLRFIIGTSMPKSSMPFDLGLEDRERVNEICGKCLKFRHL